MNETVQPHDNGQPTAEERAVEAFDLAERLDFRDHDGQPIRPGTLVHYLPRQQVEETIAYGWPGSVWNTRRWGIVTGLARTTTMGGGVDLSVRVHALDVSDGETTAWSGDEFFCAPERLRVLDAPPAHQRGRTAPHQAESAVLCYRWQTYWPHAVPNVLDVQSTPDREDVTCPACLHALGSQKHPAPRYSPESRSTRAIVSGGCCTDCDGDGAAHDGLCWTCRGTGHPHVPDVNCPPAPRGSADG